MKTKAYKVIMSSGPPIQIDEDEVAKVIEGRRRGADVVVRQGVINPAHYVSIVEDKDRDHAARSERDAIEQHNKYCLPAERKKWEGMQSLRDIFADTLKQIKGLTK